MSESRYTRKEMKHFIINFVIELVIYGGMVTLYFLLALRYLANPLKNLFDNNLTVYAILSLVLIVAQAVVLEAFTSALIKRFGLKRSE
mgnify:CR=1 FL=1